MALVGAVLEEEEGVLKVDEVGVGAVPIVDADQRERAAVGRVLLRQAHAHLGRKTMQIKSRFLLKNLQLGMQLLNPAVRRPVSRKPLLMANHHLAQRWLRLLKGKISRVATLSPLGRLQKAGLVFSLLHQF